MVAGISPSRVSVNANLVSCAAMTTSHTLHRPTPPPNAPPCTCPINGNGIVFSANNISASFRAWAMRWGRSACICCCIQPKSPPAQNTEPCPDKMTARAVLSSPTDFANCVSSEIIPPDIALRLSGRASSNDMTPASSRVTFNVSNFAFIYAIPWQKQQPHSIFRGLFPFRTLAHVEIPRHVPLQHCPAHQGHRGIPPTHQRQHQNRAIPYPKKRQYSQSHGLGYHENAQPSFVPQLGSRQRSTFRLFFWGLQPQSYRPKTPDNIPAPLILRRRLQPRLVLQTHHRGNPLHMTHIRAHAPLHHVRHP